MRIKGLPKYFNTNTNQGGALKFIEISENNFKNFKNIIENKAKLTIFFQHSKLKIKMNILNIFASELTKCKSANSPRITDFL